MPSPRARSTLFTPSLALTSLLLAACGGEPGTSAGGGSGGDGSGTMGEPTAALADDFGTIQTVRELADGTVLVADPLGNALYRVDMDAGTRTVIGQEGAGPGEYGQPDAVWPLPGGSTLLVDLGNGRLTVLDPDLSFVSTSPIAQGEPRPGSVFVMALPQGIDGEGRVYARAMGGGMGGELPDSAAILRVDRATMDVDTVGQFKLQDRIRTESGDAGNRNVSISLVPLSPEDAWGVAPDGSVAIARSSDYHVEWIGPDGSVTRGPPTPFDPVGIGTAEKEEWVAAQGRSGGGVSIGVSIDNGAVQTSFSRGAGGQRREIDNYTWPESAPPFYSGRLDIDGEGRVWVRRHMDAGEDATYDVFDRQGERVGTVTLSSNRRVIGFGDGTVYVVRYDEFDLNYLERYDLPTF